MRGMKCAVNDRGKMTGALIELNVWGQAWEDFYDALVSESREGEPWKEVKAEIEREAAEAVRE